MLSLKNEFIMAPVKLGYSAGDGKVTERHLAFYRRRREYAGAVALEPLYMDRGLREVPTQLGIDSDDKTEGLSSLVSMIHETGTKAIAHLNHPGRMANPKIPGNYFVSSSPQACEAGGPQPESLDREGINRVIRMFAEAAARAEKCGFDIIEIQFGHGYLMAQFMSQKVNTRTDEYGGSFENRIRLPLEVLDAVRSSTSLPVIVRISGDEMIPDGIKLPEMMRFAGILEEKGASALHVSAGSLCSTPPWFFQHMFVPKGKTWELAAKIKSEINIPVIFVGKVNTREDIDRLKKEFGAEYIAAGRALVADPDFFGKYEGKVDGEIRPCMECAQGCLGGVKKGKGLGCLVEPSAGAEEKTDFPVDPGVRTAVIGGGPAGLEAALRLAERGHTVDLYEKERLGGQFVMASKTPHKKTMEKLVSFYKAEVKRKNINVISREASTEDIKGKYDRVVIATGSKPSVPSIEGLEEFRCADILLDERLPENKNILIIGGGLTGVDIATALAPLDNRIIMVKRSTDFGGDMEMISKKLSLKMLKEAGVVFSDHTHIKKIEGKNVFAEKEGKEITFENIDLVIVSSGVKPCNALEPELSEELPVYVIGDARVPGDAQDAVRDAYVTAALV